MSIIWFNVREAFDFLISNGEVYTLRDHPKVEGIASLMSSIHGKPFYRGKVKINLVDVLPYSNLQLPNLLKPYLPKSGFHSTIEWLENVKKRRGSEPKFLYLYHVEVLR